MSLIKRLNKFLGIHEHNWTKWKIIEEGKTGRQFLETDTRIIKGNYLVQQRSCVDCGYTEMSTDKTE